MQLNENRDDIIESANYPNLDVLLISSMSFLAEEKNRILVNLLYNYNYCRQVADFYWCIHIHYIEVRTKEIMKIIKLAGSHRRLERDSEQKDPV